jgi:hypothetical protein
MYWSMIHSFERLSSTLASSGQFHPTFPARNSPTSKNIFANGGAPMPEHGRVARMSELMFAAAPAGGPFLLENRIYVLRLAANIQGKNSGFTGTRRSHHW